MVRRSLSPWLWGVLGGSHPVSLLAPEHQPRGPGILGSNLLGRRSKWFALPTQVPPLPWPPGAVADVGTPSHPASCASLLYLPTCLMGEPV